MEEKNIVVENNTDNSSVQETTPATNAKEIPAVDTTVKTKEAKPKKWKEELKAKGLRKDKNGNIKKIVPQKENDGIPRSLDAEKKAFVKENPGKTPTYRELVEQKIANIKAASEAYTERILNRLIAKEELVQRIVLTEEEAKKKAAERKKNAKIAADKRRKERAIAQEKARREGINKSIILLGENVPLKTKKGKTFGGFASYELYVKDVMKKQKLSAEHITEHNLTLEEIVKDHKANKVIEIGRARAKEILRNRQKAKQAVPSITKELVHAALAEKKIDISKMTASSARSEYIKMRNLLQRERNRKVRETKELKRNELRAEYAKNVKTKTTPSLKKVALAEKTKKSLEMNAENKVQRISERRMKKLMARHIAQQQQEAILNRFIISEERRKLKKLEVLAKYGKYRASHYDKAGGTKKVNYILEVRDSKGKRIFNKSVLTCLPDRVKPIMEANLKKYKEKYPKAGMLTVRCPEFETNLKFAAVLKEAA